MKNRRLTIFITISLLFAYSMSAQQTLDQKYNEMIENTETYEQYKVIPRNQLNTFWGEVVDTLDQNRKLIQELRISAREAQSIAENAQKERSDVQAKLDESLRVNDSISFLGIQFSKVAYHLMVWIIIIGLVVLAVILYLMFVRSNTVTVRTKREYEALDAEYEGHKTKSRESQVKLKRELQTAINQLNERRS